ncbi:unnamed protein product [Rhizophagus irregularis]|uniref:Uncharacterized protein n=1 Tax=Rhizophagus irregularis TaxID=588596 RepID=A0A916E2M3_9GLOM|nr:unnamed protein product [Rhizophagus irregularis]CAB5352774.1 unnamed protein product [Rhizophagus irregularis]
MSSIHSIHSEHSDLNDDNSIILETRLSDIQIREYDETLKLLADDHSLAYNYALEETIRLMDNLVGCPKEDIEDKIVVNFAFKAAGHLSNYEWICYDNSTIAQLEFFLHAMSSVLHILSKSIKMIDSKTRATFYKSISKFWAIYRNTKIINSNIIFSLREIRNCLRKIKDDKSNADLAFKIGGNFFDVVVSVAQKEYLAAFGSFIKVLDFEYPAGEWYYDWIDRREKFFLLCSQNISESRSIRKFYRKLMKLSKKEFVRVKRKNTKYRKFEYKMLKSGGLIGGYSLPDNIETLLFGYLQLIQKLFEKFPLQLNKYLKDLISFCNEIVETHVKKQLTFKAIEILYFIKESTENVEIKNEIELSFETWSSYHVPPPTPPVRSLSAPPSFHYASSQNKPNDIITSSPNGEPFQYNMPPDTPVSAYTSFSSPPQSIYNPASNTPTRTLTPLSQEEKISLSKEEKTPLSQEEKSKKRRRISVREIPTKVTRSLSSLKQQCTRKRIIDDVKRLFAERLKIKKDIEHTKKHYNELLVNTKDEDKAIDKNSDNFSDSILAKLNEILEEKRKEASSPSLPQIPFVSEPEPIIYNNYEIKNIYNTPETREIIIYKYIESDNNAKITNKDVNNFEIKEESKKIEESCDKNTREINVHKENDNNEEVINKNINKPKDDVESSAETVLTKEISEVEMNPDKSVDNTKEEEDEVKPFETILTREINENEMNPHLKEVKSDNLEIEENEKKESNENNVDIQSINPSESHSEEEELKKDNNIDVEENEKEENDENHVVVENINSSESHSEEEEPKKDNNIDVEENKKEKNDENNVVVENINSSESHSEEQQLKKDEINMNVEENEKEECRKCDDGDSVHSVSEKVILPEIILTHSEDSVVKESNNPNIENIVTVNQVNQVNQINQINQINQYNIIQNVQNVNNVQQPQQPDDYEGSVFLKTVRKIVKEVENIVDKAAKAHREAVLRSSLYDNNSSLSVNEIKEDEEIIEEIVEKEEIIEKMVEKEEIIEKMVEKEEIIEKMVEKEEIIEKMVEKEKEEIIEKTIEKEEVALQI